MDVSNQPTKQSIDFLWVLHHGDKEELTRY